MLSYSSDVCAVWRSSAWHGAERLLSGRCLHCPSWCSSWHEWGHARGHARWLLPAADAAPVLLPRTIPPGAWGEPDAPADTAGPVHGIDNARRNARPRLRRDAWRGAHGLCSASLHDAAGRLWGRMAAAACPWAGCLRGEGPDARHALGRPSGRSAVTWTHAWGPQRCSWPSARPARPAWAASRCSPRSCAAGRSHSRARSR